MRKEILPKWIRLFSWFYLIYVPILLLSDLIIENDYGYRAFGLVSNGSEFNLTVLLILSVLTLAVIVSYGILWGRSWAIKVGIIYSLIALIMSFSSIYLNIVSGVTQYSLEPLLLLPFLIILIKKRKNWEIWKPSDI
ncbi:MAG: hypothetical protein HRT42_14030 [Campylobacteraceae bacterium]|nr:hypothetical protein [Campylobacteraceae bacterium]